MMVASIMDLLYWIRILMGQVIHLLIYQLQ